MFSFYFLFYLATLIVSLANFKKFVDTPLRFFPLLIAYTLFNELLGYFILHFEEFSFFDKEEYNWHNIIIYNIYQFVFFGYLFWVYHEVIKPRKLKIVVKYLGIFTLLTYLASSFFQNPLHRSLYYADCFGSIASVAAVLIHFWWLRTSKRRVNRFNLMVWINYGILIFYLYLPFDILNAYLNVDFYLKYHLRQILWVVVSIMYSFFVVGFIISKRPAFQ